MITATQSNLLDILSDVLFQTGREPSGTVQWNGILEEAYAQGVFLLVYGEKKDSIAPYLSEDDVKTWDGTFFRFFSSGMKNRYHHNKVHDMMSASGVPYVILKGQASASYYPKPYLRSSGDVDFMVGKEDIEKVKAVLDENGYKINSHSDSQFHIDFHQKTITLEMHWEPSGVPNGDKGDLCREYLKDIFSTSVCYDEEDAHFVVPDAFHHGLILLLHTAHHMINSGVGLRHLCDWAVFANRLSDEEFVRLFEERLKKAGLWRFAQLLTQLCIRYLGCSPRKWAVQDDQADEEYLEHFMQDVFESGNFGRKAPERINEAKLMTTASEGKVTDGYGAANLLHALADKARTEMEICKRMPVLIPVGCIYVLYKHIRRIMKGGRPKIHISKMVSGAMERGQIYRRFRLFE